MNHFATPAVRRRQPAFIDYMFASCVIAIGLVAALMSLVMRVQGL